MNEDMDKAEFGNYRYRERKPPLSPKMFRKLDINEGNWETPRLIEVGKALTTQQKHSN